MRGDAKRVRAGPQPSRRRSRRSTRRQPSTRRLVSLEIAGRDGAPRARAAAAGARRRRARRSRRRARVARKLVDERVGAERRELDAVHARVRERRPRPRPRRRRSRRPARSRASRRRSRARRSRSRRRAGSPGSSSWSSSSVSRVVGCAPVPNARPGSITIASAPAGALSHGGPTQKRPTTTPWWNVAPAVLPALGDRPRRDVEALAQRELAGVVGVDGEAAVDLLDALREELEQLRELGLAAGDDDASQRNALFSFSKKPSSACTSSRPRASSNSSSRRRCSSLRWRGTSDVDEHALVAAAEALQHRHAAPAQHA